MRRSLKKLDSNRVQWGDQVFKRADAIDDIRTLQEDRGETPVTQKYYRLNGSIPDNVMTALFGTFAEFRRQAGLAPTRNQNAIRNAAARAAASDALTRIRKERLDYGDKYCRDRGKRHKLMIAASDLHDKDCDPFYLRVLIDAIKRTQPDVVSVVGDMFDCPEFGKYTVDPREWDLVGRLEAGLDIFKRMRNAAPSAQIDLIEGNHEARIVRHLSENSPATMELLSDFHGIGMRELFKLHQYEINYVAKFDLRAYNDSQIRREIRNNSRVYWNSVLAYHFPDGRNQGLPGINGHHHSHQVWHQYNRTYGSYEWHQMGAGHRRSASYTDGEKWSNGFAIINVDSHTNEVLFDYVTVGKSFAVCGGRYYERGKDEV